MMHEPAVISAVILAAGASRRMGQAKMLLPWGNTVVIQKVVSTLLESGISRPVIVTGRSAVEIKKVIQDNAVIWSHNPDYETTEMLQSLQIGLKCLPEICSAFLIVLGDQPHIETEIIGQIITAFNTHQNSIIIPSYQFRRGHPWLVSRDLLPELLSLSEGSTLRQFLNAHTESIAYLNVTSSSVLMDLDTPTDYDQQKPKGTVDEKDTENKILAWKLTPVDSGLAVDQYDLGQLIRSLDEASALLPGGVYTTLRTYSRTKVMHMEHHFLRLQESAQKVNAGFYPQVTALRSVLKQVLNASPYPECRLRVTLDLENEPGCFYVTLERLHVPPDADYQHGVRAITHRMQRDNPKAKVTKFLTTASKLRSQFPSGINEMLMVDPNGILLEGLSSNFYGVIAGSIWTVDEGVLPGITQSAVLEIAKLNKISVTFGGIQISQLMSMDECFITSASRGVLPVVQIDDTVIGDGKPGKLSRKLILLFNQWVEKTIEEI